MNFHFDDAEFVGFVREVDEFVDVAQAMRAAQKRYFRERTQSALQESKRLERIVDSYIQAWHDEEGNRQAWMASAST